MKKYLSIKFVKENILIILVTMVSAILRFWNLGYSDFQGDEIKALYLPSENQNFFSFIMDQRKGPTQFFITYLLKFLDPAYNHQFFLRLPFAIAGFLAVIYFFKFVKIHFGNKVAFYSSLFFATNGFFIAFSRIIQYQSFVILFMILSLYFFSIASKKDEYKVKGIYFGMLTWALSLLSHYDGIFILPFAFYLIFSWFKKVNLSKEIKIKTLILSSLIFILLTLSFYVPFILTLSDSTKEYWSGRITGDVSGKISSSLYLFTVYQPIYAVHIYITLFLLGSFFILVGLFSNEILKIKKLPSLVKDFFTHSTDLMSLIQKERLKIISLLIWFLISILFFEWYVYISGTHIYTYIVPTFIILSLGLVTLESVVFKVFEYQLVKIFNFLGVFVIFFFLAAQSYTVFVDHYREYPWEEKDFLIWRFPKPNKMYHISLFGFPYYRDWEGIRAFVKQNPEFVAYNTNETNSISRFYIGLDKNTDRAGFYVFIKTPQSFEQDIDNDKVLYWTRRYEPQFTLTKYGRDMVMVFIMEPGTFEEVLEKGF